MVKRNRRKWILGGAAAVAAAGGGAWALWGPKPAPIGFAITPDELERARALLRRHPAVDAHAHPGRTFVRGAEGLRGNEKIDVVGVFQQEPKRLSLQADKPEA